MKTAARLLATAVFLVLMWAGLWVAVRPIYWARDAWGVDWAWVPLLVIVPLAYIADKWLDKRLPPRPPRRGPPEA